MGSSARVDSADEEKQIDTRAEATVQGAESGRETFVVARIVTARERSVQKDTGREI